MLIPSLQHIHFFHFSDTCYLGFNDSTKFLESIVVFEFFWKAALVVVLECYEAYQVLTLDNEHAKKYNLQDVYI